jgi:acyl-CoA thioester hydrolase
MSNPNVFRRTRIVADDDVDFLGHVNNVVWVRYVIEIAEGHARSRASTSSGARDSNAQWIVRRHEIDYRASANAGEEILEETWVDKIRGARSLRASRFTRASNGELLVEALTQWAFVDASTLRPRRIPRELLDAYRSSS